MKKFVQKRLLPLLFSLSLCFFGSLNANAYEFEYLSYPLTRQQYLGYTVSDIVDDRWPCEKTNGNVHVWDFESTSTMTFNNIMFGDDRTNFYYPFDAERYKYIVVGSFACNYTKSTDLNYNDVMLDSIELYTFNGSSYSVDTVNADITKSTNANTLQFNYVFDLTEYSDLSILNFVFNPAMVYSLKGNDVCMTASVVAVPLETSEGQTNAIIKAIQDQTDDLNQAIDESTEDIQQSIEDQYGGDPSEELDVDSIISDYDEKMGVLTFGSDVMIQFLDMFQSANVGTAELTLPGFNITVENVEYAVWPDYSFNFEQLNDWVPALMSVIRIMLPAFVWLMVLRYCIKVFEDNFLSK